MKKSRKTKKVKEKSPEIVEIEEIQENAAGKKFTQIPLTFINLINTYPGNNVILAIMVFQFSIQPQIRF